MINEGLLGALRYNIKLLKKESGCYAARGWADIRQIVNELDLKFETLESILFLYHRRQKILFLYHRRQKDLSKQNEDRD